MGVRLPPSLCSGNPSRGGFSCIGLRRVRPAGNRWKPPGGTVECSAECSARGADWSPPSLTGRLASGTRRGHTPGDQRIKIVMNAGIELAGAGNQPESGCGSWAEYGAGGKGCQRGQGSRVSCSRIFRPRVSCRHHAGRARRAHGVQAPGGMIRLGEGGFSGCPRRKGGGRCGASLLDCAADVLVRNLDHRVG